MAVQVHTSPAMAPNDEPSPLGNMIRSVGNALMNTGKPVLETAPQNPMKVAFNGERLEVAAYLGDAESVDS